MPANTRRWLIVTVVGAVALVAGFSGAWLHNTIMKAPDPASLHDRLHATIDLGTEQHRKLDAIEQDFQIQKTALENEMRLANRELADAMAQDNAYTPKVQAAIDHFHHAMGELQKATIEHVYSMRTILTPAQQISFDAHIRSTLIASSQGGNNGQQGR